MKEKKKKNKWVMKRHRVIRNIAYWVIAPYAWLKYGVKVEKFRQQGDRQYLVAMNHQTAFDQFFVGMAFRGPVYYVASEDLFSNGWISRLLEFAVKPIPIKKQTNDPKAVYNCIRVAREGGTIALAPEGNRTFGGRPVHMKPSIVKLVRALKLPLVLFRIEGGYGVGPRWSDVVRRGGMRAYVSRVVEPEEYNSLSDEAFLSLIKEELNVDETKVQGQYRHRKLAEYLERAMYVCPDCGLSEFESHGDVIHCRKCGWQIRYLPTKELEGIEKPFPYRFVADWYDAQSAYINSQDFSGYVDTPIYTDHASLYEVILYQKKHLLQKETTVQLFGDRIELNWGTERMTLPFADLQVVTVLGRNKLNLYTEDHLYQLKSGKRFNALKYVHIFYRQKNIMGGNEHGEFLGL